MIKITRERPEIARLLGEGRRLIAIRNGNEYVFDLPEPQVKKPQTFGGRRKREETDDG